MTHSSGNFLRRERLRLAMRLAYQIFAIIFCVSDASLGGARPFVAKAPVAHLRNSFPHFPAETKPLSLVVLSPSTEHSSDWLRDTNATIAWMVVGGAPNDGPRSSIRLNVSSGTPCTLAPTADFEVQLITAGQLVFSSKKRAESMVVGNIKPGGYSMQSAARMSHR